MTRKGRDFELAYKWLYELDQEKYNVKSPAFLYDPIADEKREIDVLVTFYDKDNIRRSIAIECRDRKNKQDVTWIEQLVRKKEDLSLDYLIATTTTNFSQGAINKAKYHGVILERADLFNIQSFNNLTSNDFFFDVFYFKISHESLILWTADNNYIIFKDFFNSLNTFEKNDLIAELNKDYFYSVEPRNVLNHFGIADDIFFQNDKDNSISINNTIVNCDNNMFPLLVSKGIVSFDNKIKIIPYRLSLSLDQSISVFNVENKSNKNYVARYGNDNDNVEIGYINDKIYSKINLSKRKYLRLAGGVMHLNTIFPRTINNYKPDWNNLFDKLIGEFDFSRIT